MRESNIMDEISTKNIGHYKKESLYEYKPDEFCDVLRFVQEAFSKKEPFYVVSTGFNWGLGSKIPTSSTNKVLNLSCLNRIIDYDESNGVVVIEPGVTQQQLSNFLNEKKSKYFLDVTGSSMETSIIGNTLERGISYNRLRVEGVQGLEVVTGDGRVLKTGNWRTNHSKVKYSYKYGVGPDLTSLFFQSNLGVVTKMAFKLIRKKKYNSLVQIKYKNLNDVLKSLPKYSKLIEANTITDIFHIANGDRALGVLIPYYKSVFKDGKNLETKFKKALGSEWVATGVISSQSFKELKIKEKAMKRFFKKHAEIRIFNTQIIPVAEKLLGFFKGLFLYKFIKTTTPFRMLYFGISTNATIGTYLDKEIFRKQKDIAKYLDDSKIGFAYCLPLTEMTSESCESMVVTINRVSEKYGFDPSITLNPILENVIEAVVSVEFKEEKAALAHDCMREMHLELTRGGHQLYRVNIKEMDLVGNDISYNNQLKKLKEIYDPANIISPGRYIL